MILFISKEIHEAFNYYTTISQFNIKKDNFKSDWLRLFNAINICWILEIRMIYTSRPQITSFCKKFQATNSQYLSKSKVTIWANSFQSTEKLRKFLGKTDVDIYSHHNFSDISQSYHWLGRVSGGSVKNKFANNFFRFWDIFSKKNFHYRGRNLSSY